MKSIITLHDLDKRYAMASSEVTVLQNLNLDVAPEETVAIIGPSGSGKTTLLLILTGLETPSSGEITIAGTELAGLSSDQRADLRRQHIGIVFQSFHLIPSLTASENVALPLEIDGQSDSRARAAKMLERVGLGTLRLHDGTLHLQANSSSNSEEHS